MDEKILLEILSTAQKNQTTSIEALKELKKRQDYNVEVGNNNTRYVMDLLQRNAEILVYHDKRLKRLETKIFPKPKT